MFAVMPVKIKNGTGSCEQLNAHIGLFDDTLLLAVYIVSNEVNGF
jgi:hypothetical protein